MSTNTIIGWVVIVLILGGVIFMAAKRPAPTPTSELYSQTVDGSLDTSVPADSSSLTSSPMPISSPVAVPFTPISKTVTAVLKTSKGDITLSLDGTKAPLAVGNFAYLAKQGFYNGVAFHRVIPDFMIQTGDPLSKDPANRARMGSGGPGYEFANETNDLKFVRGSLGMANAGPDTNGSQFFIVVTPDASFLNGGYTNFGTVTAGMDVADQIVSVPRDANDNPNDPITITQVVISGE